MHSWWITWGWRNRRNTHAYRHIAQYIHWQTPANNSERSCPHSHENSQTSPRNSCPKITALVKSPFTHPLQNCIPYLQLGLLLKPLNPLTYAKYSPSNRPGLLAHHYIFLHLGLQYHPLWSSATAPQPMLHQLFETDSQKTSVGSLILLTHLLT